ncbi:MAG: hypothetical protein NVS3B9_5390 [Candidatus Doudnabacteria bacterium]
MSRISETFIDRFPKANSNTAPFQIHYERPLNISAKAFLVYDFDSNKILISNNATQKLPIASLTKLMTSVVASEDPDFAKPITITAEDIISTRPILGLRPGDIVLPKNLIRAALIGSANDAAWALGDHLGGREQFVKKMNQKAQQLGMRQTRFDNTIGHDSVNNYSTAEDLQKLVQCAMNIFPFEEIGSTKTYSFKSQSGEQYSIKNSNGLLDSHPEIRSIKTGQTPQAMGNMIVEAHSPEGHPVVSIVLGSADRNVSTIELINYIVNSFVWRE